MTKRCPKCKQTLPIDNFGLRKSTRDGFNCWCKACCRANVNRYRSTEVGAKKHRDQENARHKADPEYARKKSKEWHYNNLEKAKKIASEGLKKRRVCPIFRAWETIRQTDWARRNPGKSLAKTRKKQMAEKQRMPEWLSAIQRAQIEEFYDISAALYVQTGVKYHVDHIIPLRAKEASGLHVPWNLEVIPASINCSKANAMPPEHQHLATVY